MLRRVRRGLLVAVLMWGTTACSADSDSTPDTTTTATTPQPSPLVVDQIDDAVAALEAELGSAQRYFEVNATPTLVNLFVAVDDATSAVAYVYAAGDLRPPAAAQPAQGETFTAGEIDFDAATVLNPLVAELGGSTFRTFAVLADPAGGVRYVVTVETQGGSLLDVPVAADGTVLGID